ncbi:cytochrome P450 [Scytonema sp. NUACC26]|uniref:cytochrome P450 n=1 Tax=Scytonema sp. NUACC26 TaxID=3140176 RepID=UPI0034DC95FB
MANKDQILQAHDRQIWLSGILARVGYNTPIGKFLRLVFYYMDAFLILNTWRDFLYIRRDNIGEKFFAVDHAIMHTSHAKVRELMQTEPQLRGNDLGIIRMLAPSYLLNNPLTLGMNGSEHTGARAVILQALPEPTEHAEVLGYLVDRSLAKAAIRGQVHIGDDLPKMLLEILHQLVFEIALSETEIDASRNYNKGLVLASLPNFINQYLLAFITFPRVQHRKRLIERYKESPRWQSYLETGSQYQLNAHQVANSLFDTIHIAGTAGTSALLGSVIGVLCLDERLRNDVVSEVNAVWDGTDTPSGHALEQLTLLHKVIYETARMYPPVRFVSQLTTEGGEVEIGGRRCPFQRGTRLLGSTLTANRDANRYNNPDSFDVTRDFSDIVSWNGEGHERACPGKSLSIGIIKMFCLYLFKKYQWDSFTQVKWDFEKVTAVTPNDLVLQGFTHR